MSRTTLPRPADIKRRLSSVGPEGLGGRAGWSLVVELLGLASSVLVFFALTNLIVRSEIGTMTAVLALAVPVASLTSFGSHVMLIKRIAHGDDVRDVWRRATSVGMYRSCTRGRGPDRLATADPAEGRFLGLCLFDGVSGQLLLA